MSDAPVSGAGSVSLASRQAGDQAGDQAVEPSPAQVQRGEWLHEFEADLGEAIVGSDTANDLVVRVAPAAWRRAGEACKARGYTYFCFLSGIDWQPNPGLAGEKSFDAPAGSPVDDDGQTDDAANAGGVTMESGVAGGDTRFQVFARLIDVDRQRGITLKADLDDVDPRIESWVPVFRGAEFHEREIWEMFGFNFDGHPGLRHMYLPGEFEGYPLRKDFPLLARQVKPWPGLVDVEPMPGEAAGGDDPAATEGE